MSVTGGDEHLSDDQVLLACDGEAGSAAERHLRACPACRERIAGVRELEQACRRGWLQQERAQLPPPPGAWRPLPGQKPRLRQWQWQWQWMAVAAALVLLAMASLWQMTDHRRRPSIQSASVPVLAVRELVERARQAEPPWRPTDRIAIRSRKQGTLVRPAIWIRKRGAPHPIESLFRRAGYSWEQPLSVRSYADWREKLPRKEESVSRARHPKTAEPLYVLHTRTTESVLEEATLSVRERDLKPVSGVLRFAGQEVVEMEEVAEPAAPSTTSSSDGPPDETSIPDGPFQELQVLAALHKIGVDLGEPVTTSVGPDGTRVVVSASGIGERRQQQMRRALEGLTFAELRFDPAGAGNVPAGAKARQAPPQAQEHRGTVPAIRLAVEEHLQGRQTFEQFVDDALDTADAAAARAHALAALAEKFPQSVEDRLPKEGRELLESMRQDHLTAMQQHLSRMAALLQEGFGIESEGQPQGVAKQWQQQAIHLRTAMQDFDRLLTGVLTGASTGTPDPAPAAAQLGTAMHRVEQEWAALNAAGDRQ